MSGKWDPDYSHLQRHINSAIVYNIWNYFEATGDRVFMDEYGAEIIVEIARFWSSLAEYNADRDRFEIHGVMGPDEYHEKYPDADSGGLSNNVYTNITAVWCLLRAMDVLELIHDKRTEELMSKLEIDDAELERWDQITRKMIVVFHDGVISQFEGYEELDEFDWAGYQEKYDNIERLDRILKAEGDSPDHYKVSKQADVTMLLYLFQPQELQRLFARLGYELDEEDIHRNVEYYRARTSHGSTLSQVIHAWVYARSHRDRSWKSFKAALVSDFRDVQGGTTHEGIHLGAMAGTLDILQRCYSGLEPRDDVLWLNPRLPGDIRSLSFHVRYRSHWIWLDIDHQSVRLHFCKGWADPVYVGVNGRKYLLEKDDRKEFQLTDE